MLIWAVIFFIIAIIAGVFGFGGIASASAGIAQILFFVFIVLFVIALIARAVRGRGKALGRERTHGARAAVAAGPGHTLRPRRAPALPA